MAQVEFIEYVILSTRGDQSFAYSEAEKDRTVEIMMGAPKLRVEDERIVRVFERVAEYRACEYTHAHTQTFCGNPGCRKS